MKAKNMIIATLVSIGFAFGVTAQAKEKEEEQTISSSDVPEAVQQTAQGEAKGGTIVRWEKEGKNYEAVVEKNGNWYRDRCQWQGGEPTRREQRAQGKRREILRERNRIAAVFRISHRRRCACSSSAHYENT